MAIVARINNQNIINTLLSLLLIFAPLSTAIAQKPIGTVMVVVGVVKAEDSQGVERGLSRRDTIYEGDKLVTKAASRAQLRLKDGSIIDLQPNSKFIINKFNYDAVNPQANSNVMTLVTGGFRTLTGAVADKSPDNYEVNSKLATMGVRGTFWGAVFADVAAGAINPLNVSVWNDIRPDAKQSTVVVKNEVSTFEIGPGMAFNNLVVVAKDQPIQGSLKPSSAFEQVDIQAAEEKEEQEQKDEDTDKEKEDKEKEDKEKEDKEKEDKEAKDEKKQEEKEQQEKQKTEEKKAEDKKSEEQKAEQQKAEQQKAEQQKAEQQKAEQQKAEQQKAEQQKAEQPTKQQQQTDQAPEKPAAPATAATERQGLPAGQPGASKVATIDTSSTTGPAAIPKVPVIPVAPASSVGAFITIQRAAPPLIVTYLDTPALQTPVEVKVFNVPKDVDPTTNVTNTITGATTSTSQFLTSTEQNNMTHFGVAFIPRSDASDQRISGRSTDGSRGDPIFTNSKTTPFALAAATQVLRRGNAAEIKASTLVNNDPNFTLVYGNWAATSANPAKLFTDKNNPDQFTSITDTVFWATAKPTPTADISSLISNGTSASYSANNITTGTTPLFVEGLDSIGDPINKINISMSILFGSGIVSGTATFKSNTEQLQIPSFSASGQDFATGVFSTTASGTHTSPSGSGSMSGSMDMMFTGRNAVAIVGTGTFSDGVSRELRTTFGIPQD